MTTDAAPTVEPARTSWRDAADIVGLLAAVASVPFHLAAGFFVFGGVAEILRSPMRTCDLVWGGAMLTAAAVDVLGVATATAIGRRYGALAGAVAAWAALVGACAALFGAVAGIDRFWPACTVLMQQGYF